MRAVRRRYGGQRGEVRRLSGLLELPDMQEYEADIHWDEVPEVQGGRCHRAEDQAQTDLLRLFALSRLRLCLLGQACCTRMRHMRESVPGPEIQSKPGRISGLPLLQGRDRQGRASGRSRVVPSHYGTSCTNMSKPSFVI